MATRIDQQTVYQFEPVVTLTNVTPSNLLVATMVERSGFSDTDHVMTDDGVAGWTKRVGATTEQGNSSARRSFSVWTKVAAAGDSGALTVDADITGTTTTNIRLSVQEYQLAGGETEWTFLEFSQANTGTGSTSPLSTGSTASVTGGEFFVLGVAGWRHEGTDIDGGAGISWSNSLGTELTDTSGVSGQVTISTAFKDDTAQSTYSSSVSWNGTGHECNAAILVFRIAAGAAPPSKLVGRSIHFDFSNKSVVIESGV